MEIISMLLLLISEKIKICTKKIKTKFLTLKCLDDMHCSSLFYFFIEI